MIFRTFIRRQMKHKISNSQLKSVAGYFDKSFYKANYPDIDAAAIDPLLHYIQQGWKELRDPSADFSTAFYLESNPDVRESGMNPLLHYAMYGQQEGRAVRPAPGVSIASRSKQSDIEQIAAILEPRFDVAFYKANYPDIDAAAIDPLLHYIQQGWKELRDPSADFSTAFYLESNPDVRESGMNPLLHYAMYGQQEGRAVRPAPGVSIASRSKQSDIEQIAAILEPRFDVAFYKANYPDIDAAAIDPLLHYIQQGWKELRDPSADFSTAFYLESNPDVRESGMNPLLHYAMYGQQEGRAVRPAPGVSIASRSKQSDIEQIAAILEPRFDVAFYKANYPDIDAAAIDPLLHYIQQGWKELRDPSADFSTAFYLESNPDIKAAKINPFFHYIVAGRHEGRRPVIPGGYKTEVLRSLQPLEQSASQWQKSVLPEKLLTIAMIKQALLQARLSNLTKLIISVSHDDYRNIPGGVQLCIQREQQLAKKYGAAYMHLRPWQPIPYLARRKDEDPLVAVVVNGRELGACPTSMVAAAILEIETPFSDCKVIIHHLLGHSPERIGDLVKRVAKSECLFWLHDFFSLCPSYALQRNTINFCGAPEMRSNACMLCNYGEERIDHVARIKTLFGEVKVNILSPSKVTKDFWETKADYRYFSIQIIPHVNIEWEKNGSSKETDNDDSVHVGFLGITAPHKGWNVFANLVAVHRAGGFYKFHYFGASKTPMDGILATEVKVTAEAPNRMIDAVADNRIDFVLHWATCSETFSFSAHEALASGAFVITNSMSGNVAAVVEETNRGIVFDTEEELRDFFESSAAIEYAMKVRKERQLSTARYRWSEISLELMK